MVNFKGLGATLLAKETAERKSETEKVVWCRTRIDCKLPTTQDRKPPLT